MKTLNIISVLLFVTMAAYSQDFHLSQYQSSNLYQNPAVTGLYDGDYRVHIQHRSQWGAVVPNSFRTEYLSFDKKFERFSVGAYILNNRAGVGKFNYFNFFGSGSYEVTIDPSHQQHLIFGVQLGIVQNSFDFSQFTFDNQYSSAHGGIFDPNIDSGELFEKTSVLRPDANFGVIYMYQNRFNYFNQSVYKSSTYSPYAGAVISHLTQPNLTFSEFKNKLYRRYMLYAGCKIKVSTPLCVEPNITYMRQLNINELQLNTTAYYYVTNFNAYFFGNVSLRTRDAFIISGGAIYGNYRLGISYDFNTSTLRTVTSGRGGFEISLTYTKFNNKSYPMF